MNILILLSKFTMDFSMDKENANPSHLDPRFKTNKLIVLYIIAESLKLLISSLLIYGVTRSKPSYLIPFFLMQCFYFFRSVSFFLENYTNMQTSYQNGNVYQREIYGDNLSKGPSKGQDVPPSYQMMIFFFSLLYKLYFITCVFKCYKYLKLKEATFQLNQELPGAGWQFRQVSFWRYSVSWFSGSVWCLSLVSQFSISVRYLSSASQFGISVRHLCLASRHRLV